MEKDETVLYVSEVQMLVTRGNITVKESKKIVVTIFRCYIFWDPYNVIKPLKPLASKHIKTQEEVTSNVSAILDGLLNKPSKPSQEENEHYSITGEPQHTIEVTNKYAKIVDFNHPILVDYLYRTLREEVTVENSVLLIHPANRKIQFFFFKDFEVATKFIKAIECCNAWIKYYQKCIKERAQYNLTWSYLLQRLSFNPSAMVVIDPNDFLDSSDDYVVEAEMKLVCELIDSVTNIFGIQFKFKIDDDDGYYFLQKFIMGIEQFRNVRKLVIIGCNLGNDGMSELTRNMGQLSGLVELNVSRNRLTDICLQHIRQMFRMASYLKVCNFGHNSFALELSEWFRDLLNSVHQLMVLDFTHNIIDDKSIDSIEGTILYAQNPPIEHIDISCNRLSTYGIWRLFLGNLETRKKHPSMAFTMFPVKFMPDIFREGFRDWSPRIPEIDNSNDEQSQSEEIMSRPKTIGIRIMKLNISGKRMPTRKKEIQKTKNIIKALASAIAQDNVNQLYEITKQIKIQDFEFPLTSLKNAYIYLNNKMNESLFLRNHEYISMVQQAAEHIGLNLSIYRERTDTMQVRKNIFTNRLYRFLNFQMHEMDLVVELEEIVKEALRLNLGGPAIKALFSIKLEKDKKVKSLVSDNYNPEVELRERRIQNYVKLYEYGVVSHEEIPLELKQQQSINSNLFEVNIQTNYYVLSKISQPEYTKIEAELRTGPSTPSKFYRFIKNARQRLLFIINQCYNDFDPEEFKISFEELKLNVCRLTWLYHNIETTEAYASIHNFPRKVPITPQKHIRIANKSKFMKTYAIYNYEKIRLEARKQGVFNWTGTYTTHPNPEIQQELQRVYISVNKMLNVLIEIKVDIKNRITNELQDLIRCVKQSSSPEDVLEEMYIQIICFKGMKNVRAMENLVQIIPFLTFYLRPPISIEKQLIAYLAEHHFDFDQKALSITFSRTQLKCVDRDWLPSDKMVPQLIRTNGKIKVPITTTQKQQFILELPQSSTVEHLFNKLLTHESIARFTDKTLFWIYKYNSRSNSQSIIMIEDYIGEIMSNFDEETDTLMIRRRIFQPYYMVCYGKYSQAVLTSIYYEIKFFYLRGFAYLVEEDKELTLAKIFIMVEIFDRKSEDYENDVRVYSHQLKSKIAQLFPKPSLKKRLKNPKTLKLLQDFLSTCMIYDRDLLNPTLNKRKFLDTFRDYDYFCSTNYEVQMQPEGTDTLTNTLISISSQYIYIAILKTPLFYQNILFVVPKQQHVIITGYDKIKEVTFVLEMHTPNHRVSVSIVMDILSYCTLRLLISNKFLYYQRELYQQLIVENKLDISQFETNLSNEEIIEDLWSGWPDEKQTVEDVVNSIRKILEQLQGMELITFKEKDIIHCQKTRYCKVELDREPFPLKKKVVRRRLETNISGMQQEDWEEDNERMSPSEAFEKTRYKQQDTTMLGTKRQNPLDTTGRGWQPEKTARHVQFKHQPNSMDRVD